MVETDAEVFLRSRKELPACRGGDFPSFGAEVALLSHENGPVILRDGGCGVRVVLEPDLEEELPQGTPGREAENPVKRDGSGGGLF
jgi:hypothetical protein